VKNFESFKEESIVGGEFIQYRGIRRVEILECYGLGSCQVHLVDPCMGTWGYMIVLVVGGGGIIAGLFLIF
jgi:hypothetical protein